MKWILTLAAGLLLVSFYGCTTGPESQGGRITMYLTDAPAQYDAVNIVVNEVAVHTSGGGWVVVNNSPQTYDLLTLRNGATVVLGSAPLLARHYTQIRLILGQGSNVVVDGQTYDLIIPSNEVKLFHQFTIEDGINYELLLDFDASRSIIRANQTFRLNPTIRVQPMTLNGTVPLVGSIGGSVAPPFGAEFIMATSSSDTTATFPDWGTGSFKLIGLPSGMYLLKIKGILGLFRDTTLSGVLVAAGDTTNLGTITLQP